MWIILLFLKRFCTELVFNFTDVTEMVPNLIWAPDFFGPQEVWAPRNMDPKKFGPPHESHHIAFS